MSKEEIREALKQMSNLERLEMIEFASRLMREEEIQKNFKNQDLFEEIEIAEGVTTKLKSNSAQAKALKRITSPKNNDEWIIVDEVGQEIDMDAVKEKFKQRGYKSKISATQTSTTGK